MRDKLCTCVPRYVILYLINFVNLIKSNEVSKCKWKDQINLASVCNKCLKLGNKNYNFVTLSTVVLSTLILLYNKMT